MSEALAWVEPMLRPIIALGTMVTSGGVIALYSANRKSKAELLALANTAEDKLNTHYATELKSLREQLVTTGNNARDRAAAAETRHMEAQAAADERFNRAMAAADERERACEERVRELRDEVRLVSEEMIGLRRNVGQSARSAIVLAANSPSIPIQESADRAATALGEADDRLRNLPHAELPE